jgi:hypothetical protein
MSIIKSIKGLFGQTIHYKDGVRIGETWDSIFSGVKNHYDANGSYAGSSSKGIFADEVHYDRYGGYVGSSHKNAFGGVNHYGNNGSFASSDDGLFATSTYIDELHSNTLFDSDADDQSFDSGFDSFDSPDW